MKCVKCGAEGESKFCPECGTQMEEMKVVETETLPAQDEVVDVESCAKDEQKTEMKEAVEFIKEEAKAEDSSAQKRKKNSGKMVAIVAVILIVAGAIGGIGFWLGGKEGNTDEGKASGDNVEITENQGKELPGGTYVIGSDFPAGKYKFCYKTESTEDDYWSNDYFWITRKGSKGKNETLGGTKYDERFGDVEYQQAQTGKMFFANLKEGDTIVVDCTHGTWTY